MQVISIGLAPQLPAVRAGCSCFGSVCLWADALIMVTWSRVSGLCLIDGRLVDLQLVLVNVAGDDGSVVPLEGCAQALQDGVNQACSLTRVCLLQDLLQEVQARVSHSAVHFDSEGCHRVGAVGRSLACLCLTCRNSILDG